jgi:hypothetical protein
LSVPENNRAGLAAGSDISSGAANSTLRAPRHGVLKPAATSRWLEHDPAVKSPVGAATSRQ